MIAKYSVDPSGKLQDIEHVCICTGTIKNNHNFMVQIIYFFEKMFKLYTILAYAFFNHTFLKYVIVSHIYIYIYIYI